MSRFKLMVCFTAAFALTAMVGECMAQNQTVSPEQRAVNRERRQAYKQKCQARFTEMDTNGDGVVSRDEFMSAPHKRQPDRAFQMKDADGDGALTQKEFCTRKKKLMQKEQ